MVIRKSDMTHYLLIDSMSGCNFCRNLERVLLPDLKSFQRLG